MIRTYQAIRHITMNRPLFDGHLPANAGELLGLDPEDALYYSPVLSHAGIGEAGLTDPASAARSLEEAAAMAATACRARSTRWPK